MINDTDRIEWLIKHCEYLEHDLAEYRTKKGGWWPQREEDDSDVMAPKMIGLGLREYIDALIEKQKQ